MLTTESNKEQIEKLLKLAERMAKTLEVFEAQGSDKTDSLRAYLDFMAELNN